eukprot:TRINITY_DN7552_c0_g1_i5.p3 TRINITY_DN7552_c0_g1~~TRINITY_DN7552_c0_g1_i5.p3  ORF type:complete len:151 (+),score=7.16 TRINITY_DN7552_c0_g1_i5:1841-2293(+)
MQPGSTSISQWEVMCKSNCDDFAKWCGDTSLKPLDVDLTCTQKPWSANMGTSANDLCPLRTFVSSGASAATPTPTPATTTAPSSTPAASPTATPGTGQGATTPTPTAGSSTTTSPSPSPSLPPRFNSAPNQAVSVLLLAIVALVGVLATF